MNFEQFRDVVGERIKELFSHDQLYVAGVDPDEFYDVYLDAFPKGANEIFRERREFDCSSCRSFIKRFGQVVAIEDGQLLTIWDVEVEEPYQTVVNGLASLVRMSPIVDSFIWNEKQIGVKVNREMKGEEVVRWNHLYCVLPDKFIFKGTGTIDGVRADRKTNMKMLKKSLVTITNDAVDTVLELIAQKSLYKGEEWQTALVTFRKLQAQFDLAEDKSIFVWANSGNPVLARMKNHSIGTLLVDISEGKDLDRAVKAYEKIVAPANHKRTNQIITQKQKDAAEQWAVEEGYIDSLYRQHAVVGDVTINNVLWANRDVRQEWGSPFGELMTTEKPKTFDKITEISIEDFIKNVLPTATSIKAMFENKHERSLVSTIAPVNPESKNMLKWDNRFTWAYNGNYTDSMRETVKSFGGDVGGAMRFSFRWNDYHGDNLSDLDAHCEMKHARISFNDMYDRKTNGRLDVDIRRPQGVAVENITWPNLVDDEYLFRVHQYARRSGSKGFTAELEINGDIYSYSFPTNQPEGSYVDVATVVIKKGVPTIKHHLKESSTSKELWGISTNKFHDVSLMMFSPNYWDEQKGQGHKHYFFVLNKCKNDTTPNGFYNEFLKQEFMKHRKTFDALGGKMKVQFSDDQLSGLGFSSTQRNELVVEVVGKTKRLLKIKF